MIGSAYITVVLGIIIAKALGFVRDIIFASVFGTTVQSDIYFQVFGLVNLIFTGVGVALSTLIIKNLNRSENNTFEKQKQYVAYFIKRTFVILLGITALLYIFARPITSLILPSLDAQMFDVALKLMYIMLPSLIFVVIAYIISGVLQNCRIFFITSIMSLPYNVIIIAALLNKNNIDILTLGIITTIGWCLHIIIQLPAFYKKGFRIYIPKQNNLSQNGQKYSEVLFIFISNMMFQLCFIIDKSFVSYDEGMIAVINYASNLFITIASVFVVAMSSVVFPSISQNYEQGQKDYVRNLIQYIIIVMFSIFVPFILVVTFFGEPIIALIYQRGNFDSASTIKTAIMFMIYTFGVFGYLSQELFNKVLYLASKYRYTVIGTILVIVLKIIINSVVVPLYGAYSAAISTTVLFTAYAIMVAIVMKDIIGKYISRDLIVNIGKIFLSGAAAVLVYVAFYIFAPALLTSKVLFLVPIMCCAVVYIAMMYVLKVIDIIINRVSKETN